MSMGMIIGMYLQTVLPTALFYLCFYAEISLGIRQWLVLWAGLGGWSSWLPLLILKIGECPACAGFWFGLLVWAGNEGWTASSVPLLDAIGAGLWSVVGVPILWWLMSSALVAQRRLMDSESGEEEEDEGEEEEEEEAKGDGARQLLDCVLHPRAIGEEKPKKFFFRCHRHDQPVGFFGKPGENPSLCPVCDIPVTAECMPQSSEPPK
jgi:hypothetical protein